MSRKNRQQGLGNIVGLGRGTPGVVGAALAIFLLLMALENKYVQSAPNPDDQEARRAACRAGALGWLLSLAFCVFLIGALLRIEAPFYVFALLLVVVQIVGVWWAIRRFWQRRAESDSVTPQHAVRQVASPTHAPPVSSASAQSGQASALPPPPIVATPPLVSPPPRHAGPRQ